MIKPRYCLTEPTKFDTNNCQTAIVSHQTYQIWYRKLSNLDTVSLNRLKSTCKIAKLRYCLTKPIDLLSHSTYYIWYETWSKCDTVSQNASTGKIYRKKTVTKHMCFTVESGLCPTGARTRALRWRLFIVKRLNYFCVKTKNRRKANVNFRPFRDVRSGMPTYDLIAPLARRMRLYI